MEKRNACFGVALVKGKKRQHITCICLLFTGKQVIFFIFFILFLFCYFFIFYILQIIFFSVLFAVCVFIRSNAFLFLLLLVFCILLGVNNFFSFLAQTDFQREDAKWLHPKATQRKQFAAAII